MKLHLVHSNPVATSGGGAACLDGVRGNSRPSSSLSLLAVSHSRRDGRVCNLCECNFFPVIKNSGLWEQTGEKRRTMDGKRDSVKFKSFAPRLSGTELTSSMFQKLPRCSPNFGTSTRNNRINPNIRCSEEPSDSQPFDLFSNELPQTIAKERHKYFDQVEITVKSGDGGNGAVLSLPQPYSPSPSPDLHGKALRKKIQEERIKRRSRSVMKRSSEGDVILPVAGNGGDVVLYADENVDDLLDLHRRKVYRARRGGTVSSVDGLTRKARDGISIPPLRIPVPVGTVVKRKRGGKFLADLAKPGDEVVVARGGRGGLSILAHDEGNRNRLKPKAPHGVTFMSKTDDKSLTYGLPGEEVTLELILRVVADVGLVGFPNAGKSSLLSCVTRAKPEIAAYPFTTLMPNLGKIPPKNQTDATLYGGDILQVKEEEKDPTIADLPGLIEGAHTGKGLGRMFLRHLRRAQLLVHLVDASARDPIRDYLILRDELRMYNPNYISRPHILVFNKIDLLQPNDLWKTYKDQILTSLREIEIISMNDAPGDDQSQKGVRKEEEDAHNNANDEDQYEDEIPSFQKMERREKAEIEYLSSLMELSSSPPLAILGISAKESIGIDDFLECVRNGLAHENSKRESSATHGSGINGKIGGGESHKGNLWASGDRRNPPARTQKPASWQL